MLIEKGARPDLRLYYLHYLFFGKKLQLKNEEINIQHCAICFQKTKMKKVHLSF